MEKHYRCKKIVKDIAINGDLNKEEWQKAEILSLVETVSGKAPRLETKVKALWSETYLYFAFQCTDDYIKATMTEYNDKLYEEDVVEVFIDDNLDLKTYVEIEVNPLNTVLHYAINNTLKGNFFGFSRNDKKVITAISKNEENMNWNMEMAIPFSEFVTAKHIPPRYEDQWLVNFYRIDRGQNGDDEYSAWSPTGKIQFHMPEKFGAFIFVR